MSEEARKAEVGDGIARFQFRGQSFEVSTDRNEWTLDMHEALEDGKEIAILRAALGPAQWAQLKRMGLKTPEINELADAAVKALGFVSAGESPASSD